jgi:hypothetical protein
VISLREGNFVSSLREVAQELQISHRLPWPRTLADIAAQFGYKTDALKAMVSKFRSQRRSSQIPPFSFLTAADDLSINDAAKTPMAPTSPQSPIDNS